MLLTESRNGFDLGQFVGPLAFDPEVDHPFLGLGLFDFHFLLGGFFFGIFAFCRHRCLGSWFRLRLLFFLV